MSPDLQHDRQRAHELLDRLPPEKLGMVRSLLEVMIADDEDGPVIEDHRRLREGTAWFAHRGGHAFPWKMSWLSSDLSRKTSPFT